MLCWWQLSYHSDCNYNVESEGKSHQIQWIKNNNSSIFQTVTSRSSKWRWTGARASMWIIQDLIIIIIRAVIMWTPSQLMGPTPGTTSAATTWPGPPTPSPPAPGSPRPAPWDCTPSCRSRGHCLSWEWVKQGQHSMVTRYWEHVILIFTTLDY